MARRSNISEFRAPEPYPTNHRFWRLVDRSGECWLWRGFTNANGYGRTQVHGIPRKQQVHRIAYELLIGPIPEGLEIDHLCKVRHCCNPAHMEPVTHKENTLRGNTMGAVNKRKTHCPQGHPYDEENTRWTRVPGRLCLTCQRQHWRNRYIKG